MSIHTKERNKFRIAKETLCVFQHRKENLYSSNKNAKTYTDSQPFFVTLQIGEQK